ncbi:MAG: SGNH/GDSL hydrolase family protein [Fibrobacter sp.]|nr:SGNH/GDSL hydrolase family protein [Fibrobacter sp.]
MKTIPLNLCLAALLFMVDCTNFIRSDDPGIQYFGRFDFSNPEAPGFDWPGVYIKARFEGTSCRAVLSGKNRYDAYVDGQLQSTITVSAEKDTFTIAEKLEDRAHDLLLTKRSESNLETSHFHGFILDRGKKLLEPPEAPERKIEFIGDSHSAGYGNEFTSREVSAALHDHVCFVSTNTSLSYGPVAARAFGAQYQVNAYSGRGLVRNYANEMPGKELSYYYQKTLISQMNLTGKSPDWDFSSWIPQVVVVNIGINDFQDPPPYTDSSVYVSRYRAFISSIRSRYPGVKIICAATSVWPTNLMTRLVDGIVKREKAEGHDDIWYMEYRSSNTALDWHPSLKDHRAMAVNLVKIIKEATGWEPLKSVVSYGAVEDVAPTLSFKSGSLTIGGLGDSVQYVQVFDMAGKLLKDTRISGDQVEMTIDNYSGNALLVSISRPEDRSIRRLFVAEQ